MLVIHISTECYPVIKNGGLADVIGALPKYLIKNDIDSRVIIPFIDNNFTQSEELIKVFENSFFFGSEKIPFSIYQNTSLDFDLYFVHIPNLLDRFNVYGYEDDAVRFLAFQIASLEWLKTWNKKIDLLHCHDHNAGLIPFFTKYSYQFEMMAEIPVVFTAHNTIYQGIMSWDMLRWFPCFEPVHTHLLTWKGSVNSMAAGIKCADQVTTVSPNYMDQLCLDSHGLEYVFQTNRYKCSGILNGIDESIWDPETDFMIKENYTISKVRKGKAANKKYLYQLFELDEQYPLLVFIGKLSVNKGGDVLEKVIEKSLKSGLQFNFLVMGKGNYEITRSLELLERSHKSRFSLIQDFDESLAHKLFAGADFYLMPSREEPCGLGQMYSLKYGTVPIVSSVGGLEDTVKNFEEKGGYGIKFSYFSIDDIVFSISKAEKIYQDKGLLNTLRKRMMSLDFSWTNQARQYINLYQKITENQKIVWELK